MRSKENADRWFDYDIHFESRTLYVGSKYIFEDGGESGVDAHMAEYLMKGLHLFRLARSTNEPVTIIMNNCGGDWYHGMAIYDFIRTCHFKVNMEVYGHVMSMGSIILQAADKRSMSPESKMMIHDGYMSMADIHPRSFERWAEESKKIRQRMYEIYASRSSSTAKYWEKQCAFDKFYTAKEAVQEGLADNILEVY